MKGEKKAVRANEPVDIVAYGSSVIPSNRLDFLVRKCRETLEQSPGNVLEVGVYRGGSLLALTEVLKETCPQFKVYAIDTFAGHPYTDGHHVHPMGKYGNVEIIELEQLISAKGLTQWVNLFRGRVEEIFQGLHLNNISFAHIDCDLHTPVKYCAENVPPIMTHGGVLYFDDYGHEHCPGATTAVDGTFDKKLLHEVYMHDDHTCWSCYIEM